VIAADLLFIAAVGPSAVRRLPRHRLACGAGRHRLGVRDRHLLSGMLTAFVAAIAIPDAETAPWHRRQ
jgi:hypothetical protein